MGQRNLATLRNMGYNGPPPKIVDNPIAEAEYLIRRIDSLRDVTTAYFAGDDWIPLFEAHVSRLRYCEAVSLKPAPPAAPPRPISPRGSGGYVSPTTGAIAGTTR